MPQFNKELADRYNFDFDVLADAHNEVARKFGLAYAFPDYLKDVFLDVFDIRLPVWNGDDSWELPIPARFIIDANGIIRDAYADPDYTKRLEPEATLARLRELKLSVR